MQWDYCKPLDLEKCQDKVASRIFKIRPTVAEILHILQWGILLWATLYIKISTRQTGYWNWSSSFAIYARNSVKIHDIVRFFISADIKLFVKAFYEEPRRILNYFTVSSTQQKRQTGGLFKIMGGVGVQLSVATRRACERPLYYTI